MKKVLILLIVVMLSEVEASKAQTWVTIPDANFVAYLHTIIPSAMSGNQMDITNTLVTTTTHTINVQSSMNITSISGIQYFTSLTYLSCGGNVLTSLPTLPNSLTYLDCQDNSLSSLPTLPNSLVTLYCNFNSLTTLPILDNALQYLGCGGNVYLTSLPALPNSLIYLNCYNDALTSLPALPNSLTYLVCNWNNIICFPTLPNSITTFSIDPNPYNCLPNYITAMDSTDLAKPLCAAGNSNGCAVAGIEQYANSNAVSIYPNPASTIINLKLEIINENTTLQITDMLGNTVKQFIIHNSPFQISVSDLAEGVYQLIIHPADGGTINKKVVIVK